jgi:hypothetical protein
LALVLGAVFGCLAMIGASTFLAIAVFKAPLFVIVLVGLVCAVFGASFLAFVGEMSPVREGHRYE